MSVICSEQQYVATWLVLFDQGSVLVDLEEEVARLRQEKEQLSQELARVLETGRRASEELGQRNRELSGKYSCRPPLFSCSMFLSLCLY